MELNLTLKKDDGTESSAKFIQFVQDDKSTWPKHPCNAIILFKDDVNLDFTIFIETCWVYTFDSPDAPEELKDRVCVLEIGGKERGDDEESMDWNSEEMRNRGALIFFKAPSETATMQNMMKVMGQNNE